MIKRPLAAAALLLAAPLSLAFQAAGSRWANGSTSFFVDIPGVSASGRLWSQAFESAMAEWSEETAFTFTIVDGYRDPCSNYRHNPYDPHFPAGTGDGVNGVAFRADMCGNALGQGVAAVTLSSNSGSRRGFANFMETDIIFNSNLSWDIYDGPGPGIDFRRTALHELGHALGLGHESNETAIMAPRVSQRIDRLQPDDIAGANVLYGGPGECGIRALSLGGSVQDALGPGDCAMFTLFHDTDTSYVDVYRLNLPRRMEVDFSMQSGEFDAVLLLTDTALNILGSDDDSGGGCNARLTGTLDAGEYLLLANSYDVPFKCAGNHGRYRLEFSSPERFIAAQSLSGAPSAARITGAVSADGGITPAESFASHEILSMNAEIQVDPADVGRVGNLFVLAILPDGRRFMQNAAGQWLRLLSLNDPMPAWRSGQVLQARELIAVASGFQPASIGLTQGTVQVFVGYSLGEASEIVHNVEALRFTLH